MERQELVVWFEWREPSTDGLRLKAIFTHDLDEAKAEFVSIEKATVSNGQFFVKGDLVKMYVYKPDNHGYTRPFHNRPVARTHVM